MAESWQPAAMLQALESSGPLLVRVAGKQIALFATPSGPRACNNRCPHEGYPLKEGSLDERCVLTCNWHNWKFDLETGDNLYGGDRLRTYPTQVRDGEIWVDVADPPLELRRAGVVRNLEDAFRDNDYERIAREIGRLELTGGDTEEAVRLGIEWSHERMEFGWTHAYAGAADWLRAHDAVAADPDDALVCLVESVAHMADDVLREPVYRYPRGVADYDEDAFVEAVEREDEASALAMVRGAVAAGLGFESIERGLTRAALAHYQQFGHSLIYVPKAGALVRRLGESVAEPLLLSLVRGLVYARREDLIPEFRAYAGALERMGSGSDAAPAWRELRELGIARAVERVSAHGGAPAGELYENLLAANAAHLVGFDLDQQSRIDGNVPDNVSWLDLTHGLTFANAVRAQCTKFPELWPRGLLQMACFIGRNKGFTLARGAFDEALGRWRVDDAAAFFERATGDLLDHGCDEFIVSVHRLKTLLAAKDEYESAPDSEAADIVLAGVNRYLSSPLKLKHARRTARQARKFVALDG